MLNYLYLSMFSFNTYRLYLIIAITFQVFFYADVVARSVNYVELKETYGQNKSFTPSTELPALIALSFYPELKDVIITFEERPIKTTMAARPHMGQLLLRDRSYYIFINNAAEKLGSVSFHELSLEAQVGIIAHELSHIVDYHQKKTLSMFKCGLYYMMFKNYHKEMERATDLDVINRGLGKQLHDFADYVINKSNASTEYKSFKLNNYLSPKEILNKINDR